MFEYPHLSSKEQNQVFSSNTNGHNNSLYNTDAPLSNTVKWDLKPWGELREQPDLCQVLKTNIKVNIELSNEVLTEAQSVSPVIGVALVCETLDGKDYTFKNGIEMQKIQIKKNIASFKVLINPISKLKKEIVYNDQLPLTPADRKSKPRFWLRFFWGNYKPIDTNHFYLFIRRDEQRYYSSKMNENGIICDDTEVEKYNGRKTANNSSDSSSNHNGSTAQHEGYSSSENSVRNGSSSLHGDSSTSYSQKGEHSVQSSPILKTEKSINETSAMSPSNGNSGNCSSSGHSNDWQQGSSSIAPTTTKQSTMNGYLIGTTNMTNSVPPLDERQLLEHQKRLRQSRCDLIGHDASLGRFSDPYTRRYKTRSQPKLSSSSEWRFSPYSSMNSLPARRKENSDSLVSSATQSASLSSVPTTTQIHLSRSSSNSSSLSPSLVQLAIESIQMIPTTNENTSPSPPLPSTSSPMMTCPRPEFASNRLNGGAFRPLAQSSHKTKFSSGSQSQLLQQSLHSNSSPSSEILNAADANQKSEVPPPNEERMNMVTRETVQPHASDHSQGHSTLVHSSPGNLQFHHKETGLLSPPSPSPIRFSPIQTISKASSASSLLDTFYNIPSPSTVLKTLLPSAEVASPIFQQIVELEAQLKHYHSEIVQLQQLIDNNRQTKPFLKSDSAHKSMSVDTKEPLPNDANKVNNEHNNHCPDDVSRDHSNCHDSDSETNDENSNPQQIEEKNNTTDMNSMPNTSFEIRQYNKYYNYTFTAPFLHQLNNRFLIIVDVEPTPKSTLRDLWSNQRPLAGNPMSVESVKGEQTHLINKGERPVICYIWLQGQRERTGTTYKVERCPRCLSGDSSENATSVLRVYGTELIRICEGKLHLKIKLMEASHHYDGDHFRICIQLYESPTPEVGVIEYTHKSPLTTWWKKCVFTRSRNSNPLNESLADCSNSSPSTNSIATPLATKLYLNCDSETREVPTTVLVQQQAEKLQIYRQLQSNLQLLQLRFQQELQQFQQQQQPLRSSLLHSNVSVQNASLPFLTLHQKPDSVQICTQVLKPHIAVKLNRNLLEYPEGQMEVELIWSYQSDPYTWRTVVVPNGVFYETTKAYFSDTELIKFKHVHLNNWTSIKNFVREHLPKSNWKDKWLKANYGLRFNIKSNSQILTYIEIPCLFNIDIRRENDPNYTRKRYNNSGTTSQ
jgi:hypothetical protein